tara:strand:- start:116 stop:721 length:606 start_codon:yes stop_codon:yes gene_type:complete
MGFNIGVAGCTQQLEDASSGGSAPTGVSIASTSSGDYDDAVILGSRLLGNSGEDALDSNDGSTATGETAYECIVEFNYSGDYTAMLNANGGVLEFEVFAYARSTGATSWTWDLSNLDVSNVTSGVLSASVFVGTPASGTGAQDRTGTGGLGERVVLAHNSGGRGYLLMPSEDTVNWDVDVTATNTAGDTDAQTITTGIEVV